MTYDPEDELIQRVLERSARAAEISARDNPLQELPRRRPRPQAKRPPLREDDAPPRATGRARKVRVLPGFSGKARVMTSFGALPIEALRHRDELRTSSGRIMRVMAIDKILLDADFLTLHPEATSIRVRAGALGRGLPQRDVVMSPRQKIVASNVASASAARVVEDMRGLPGILPMPPDNAVYYRFHVGEPAMVQVEGMWVLVEP